VQTGPDGQFVFVVKPDMTTEVRKVTVERSDGDNVIVAKDCKMASRSSRAASCGLRRA